MTRRFDLWNAIGWAMVALAVVLAAAGYVALLVHQPVATGLATSYALLALVTWWLTGRNLRAELEAVRVRLATYNASETHEALAEARSGEFEVEPFMAESGYQRPCNNCGKPAAFAWEDEGFPFAACNLCVSLWFSDGLPEWVERIGQEETSPQVNQVEHCPDDGHHVTVGRRALHDWLTWCSCGWEAETTRQSEANEQALVHRQQIVFAQPGEPLTEQEWAGFADYLGIVHVDDDPSDSLPRSLPGNGGN